MSSDGSRVACAYRKRFTVWNVTTGSPTHFGPADALISQLSFTPNGIAIKTNNTWSFATVPTVPATDHLALRGPR